jgi:hypothetical protein
VAVTKAKESGKTAAKSPLAEATKNLMHREAQGLAEEAADARREAVTTIS